MRQPLTFACDGAMLAGSLHPAPGRIGVVIVTGGLQTRHGSHRGFVALADQLAEAGFPVLRFDRRGVGDSDGIDPGFRESAPDIAAAVAALRGACPAIANVVGWGLCDGATALAMVPSGFAGVILANPWTLDTDHAGPLPPAAAIAAHYTRQITDPKAWLRLLTGAVNFRALQSGLRKLVRRAPITATATKIAAGLDGFPGPILVLLAEHDGTAATFAALLRTRTFAAINKRATIATITGATHTFPGAAPESQMIDTCARWLSQFTADRVRQIGRAGSRRRI